MKTYKMIAATGCPTGIAHTYMAQESLEEAAKKKGISIKVETHGQEGVDNPLSDSEISDADDMIIAEDKKVYIENCNGKHVLKVYISKGIKEPDELINKIMSGNIQEYKSGQVREEKQTNSEENKSSFWHSLYVSLMNGVSHMLPFVVAGGVMMAVSFMFGIDSADPASDQYNQFAYLLNTIG